MNERDLITYLKGYLDAYLHISEHPDYDSNSVVTHIFNILTSNIKD